MTQMQSADSIWLHMEPEGESMHVSLMSVYDPGPNGSLTREELVALVDARIVSRVPRFHQRLLRLPLSIDNPYWIDDSSFDLDRHISDRTLLDPGDWPALLATGMHVHAEPMDPDRPLWDVTLVTGIDDVPDFAPNSFAVVWRFHHAMVDGKAVLEIVSLLHDTTPHGGEAETGLLGRRRVEPRPSPSEIAVRAVAHLAGRPFDVANRVLRALPMIGETILSQRSLPQVAPWPAPRTRFNGRVGQQRRLGLVRFDLDRVRNLRRLVAGSTVNDIALTVVGGALRAYLLEVGELPVQSMTAACPISVRSAASKDLALGNQVSAMFVPLHTDVADPVERLGAVALSTSEAKVAQDGVGAKVMTELQRNLSAAGAAAAARLAILAASRVALLNTIVTNVPGSREPIYLAGCRQRLSVPVVALVAGLGLMHIVSSYDGELQISFIVDAQAMPDPEHYEVLLLESLRALESA